MVLPCASNHAEVVTLACFILGLFLVELSTTSCAKWFPFDISSVILHLKELYQNCGFPFVRFNYMSFYASYY